MIYTQKKPEVVFSLTKENLHKSLPLVFARYFSNIHHNSQVVSDYFSIGVRIFKAIGDALSNLQ